MLAEWIVNHMDNVTQHGIKSNVCPRCEVLMTPNSIHLEITQDINV